MYKYKRIVAFFGASLIFFQPCFSAASTVKKHTAWEDKIEKKVNWLTMNWQPVFAFSAGAAMSDTLGHSNFIPIKDPIKDEFFDYNVSDRSQTQFIYGFSLGIEALLNPSWHLQTGFSYYQPLNYNVHGVVTQGVDVPSADSFFYQYTIQPHQILFENKLLYKWTFHSKFFLPYVSAGIGVGLNTTRDYRVAIIPPFTTFSNQFSNNTNTAFSYRVGLGVDYDVTHWIRVGMGYRFADFGRVTLGDAVIDQVPTSNHISQSHFYTNEVLAQLTFVV